MADIDVRITENADEVLRLLEKASSRALKAVGMKAETYAKRDTPVDTGNLRNSIAYAVNESRKEVVIGTNVEYGPQIENGRVGYAGKHMLKNAAANHLDEYKDLIKQSMESV